MRILVVEDDPDLSRALVRALEKRGYTVTPCLDGLKAFQIIRQGLFDLIILDLNIPGEDGLHLLQRMRNGGIETPVLILTARSSIGDRIAGLNAGGDDYLSKPFHLPELKMRIFALLRRRNFTANNLLQSGSIQIDLTSKEVKVGPTVIDLTKTEYELLLFLIENRKRVVSKSALAEHLSGDMADMMDDHNFVYAHIKNLKAKLNIAGATECIKTFYGIGYKWMEDEKPD